MAEEMLGEQSSNDLQCEEDPEVSVLLHCAAWRGLLRSQVQVELSERFNRQTDTALERHIEEVWAERVSREPWLFNGAKFRLHSFSLASSNCPPSPSVTSSLPPKHPASSSSTQAPCLDCSGDPDGQLHSNQRVTKHEAARKNAPEGDCPAHQQENGDCAIQLKANTSIKTLSTSDSSASEFIASDFPSCPDRSTDNGEAPSPLLILRLGLTCYKDFLGTNWSCRAAELCRRGEADFGDPLALLAQPLGVGGVLCTCDGQVVLIRRSQRVAEAGGLLDIPGGHPEPKVVCEALGQEGSEEHISLSVLQQRQEAVVSELFSSVCAEIRDEVNVPVSFLGEPVLMGVALNHTSAGRPSAEFYISCSLTSDEVRELYWRGGAEAHESTDIVFLGTKDMLQLNSRSPLWRELCPSAKGAVLLYQLMRLDREPDSS
ncbi:uridine diphosphate glucose pyrophosphatase NUDT22 [Myripristis murdjan]|uniref:Nudix (nucleoside diphosphate linked moiety X)-type motif 22 n=1 Tax=Myripristis murdjan TaxID=586833 RepID=A0A667ZLR8_9TELE|nr:uridine diphosphate glucose pyrophosphatase [Myripristis murdjan]